MCFVQYPTAESTVNGATYLDILDIQQEIKKLHFTKRYLTALISKRLQLYEPQSPRYPISFDRTKWTRRSLSQH